MEKKPKITQYRERLDKTLASPDLTNKETLKALVKNQLLHSWGDETKGCNQEVIEKRSDEVSYFLDMLRSVSVIDNEGSKASGRSQTNWKLKQDNEEFRVMYREGPEGTPFHTLLVEGYVDGPLDVCLCISWESSLYMKWWPQTSIPTFKIISCKCLQKVRIGEQISLVRMKISWPLSTREAIVHYFLFEYLQDDLLVVLLNSISNLEGIDINTHGFTSEGIPEAKDVVRIDVVGGFAMQKVTPERSYFRTIANMDVKLDFVPPSLINFISRQLIGTGFRLYQKVVSSTFKSDEDFSNALRDPLYAKIREAMYSTNVLKETVEVEEPKTDACTLSEEHPVESKQDDTRETNQEVYSDCHISELEPKDARATSRKAFGEIEEEESQESRHFEEDSEDIDNIPTKEFRESFHVNGTGNILVRPEVEQALGTLDKVISVFRERGFNAETGFSSGFVGEQPPNVKKGLVRDSNSSKDDTVCSNGEVSLDIPKRESIERTSQERARNSSSNHSIRRTGSNSHSKEVNHNKVAPASPEPFLSVPSQDAQIGFGSTGIVAAEVVTLDQTNSVCNGIHEGASNEDKSNRQKKHRLCCFRARGFLT